MLLNSTHCPNEADGTMFSPRMILGENQTKPNHVSAWKIKQESSRMVLQPGHCHPPAQPPGCPRTGDRALPASSSFTILKGRSSTGKPSASLQPCSLCMDRRTDRQGTISRASSRAASCAQLCGCRELKIPAFNRCCVNKRCLAAAGREQRGNGSAGASPEPRSQPTGHRAAVTPRWDQPPPGDPTREGLGPGSITLFLTTPP